MLFCWMKVVACDVNRWGAEVMSTMVAELNALHAEVDALKRLQAETAAELDALLPSILDRAFRRVMVSKDEPRRSGSRCISTEQ